MKLPEIFKNKIDDNINNTERLFMGEFEKDKQNIFDKLPVKVKLITNKGEVTCTIVGKTKNYIIAKNGNVIYINDIKEIKRA